MFQLSEWKPPCWVRSVWRLYQLLGAAGAFLQGVRLPVVQLSVVTLTLASGLDTLFWRHSSVRSRSDFSGLDSSNKFSKVDLMYGGLNCVSFLIKGNQ